MKYFYYWDIEIRSKKTGRTYYLRHKHEKRTGKLTGTIRTHKNGKGIKIAESQITLISEKSIVELYEKLNRKFKFSIVKLVSVEDIKESTK